MMPDDVTRTWRFRFYVKNFGATIADNRFSKLPRVIEVAQAALAGEDIFGFFICALDRPPRMTGLLFLRDQHDLPPGLPAHTPPIVRRFKQAGYWIFEADTGDLFAVAHWYFQNGALAPFHVVH